MTTGRWLAAAAAWLPAALLSWPVWAEPASPWPTGCQRPEAQVHVWLIEAGPYRASPGCVVYHRSWKELQGHRAAVAARSPVRVWSVAANRKGAGQGPSAP